jgi:hypothetical protein
MVPGDIGPGRQEPTVKQTTQLTSQRSARAAAGHVASMMRAAAKRRRADNADRDRWTPIRPADREPAARA